MQPSDAAHSGFLKDSLIFKGKGTKSWHQLPPDILRYIATFYLLNVQSTHPCPSTWIPRETWPSRLVYGVLRDAIQFEKLMLVCPLWHAALEYHGFWRHACAAIDPHDALKHHSIIRTNPLPIPPNSTAASAQQQQPQVIHLSPYTHFRNMTGCSCAICRINLPYSNAGLAAAKRIVGTPNLGAVAACKDHRRLTYCGVCLKETPPLPIPTTPVATVMPPSEGGDLEYANAAHQAYQQQLMLQQQQQQQQQRQVDEVCCAENHDQDVFPGIDTTCRLCRMDALWNSARNSSMDREAIGGPTMNCAGDWETKRAVDTFLDLGEGSVERVLTIAREQLWMKKNTKFGDMLMQALAASRFTERGVEMGMGSSDAAAVMAGDAYAVQEAAVANGQVIAADAETQATMMMVMAAGYDTSLSDVSSQASFASPIAEAGDEDEEEEDEDEDEEEDEDVEVMSMSEESRGVHNIAVADWARNRILDGFWISPADQWHGNTVPGRSYAVPASHPCPYYPNATYDGALTSAELTHAHAQTIPHPRPQTCAGPPPPSYKLCDETFRAYQVQMREILLPAMRNVLRRLVIEGVADGRDSVQRVAKMTLEDVIEELRDEGVWFNGLDWLERRTNVEREERRREREAAGNGGKEDDEEGSSAGSRSDGSHTTSPVLSTTTLQTTPSPPPASVCKDDEAESTPVSPKLKMEMPMEVAPILKSPVLLHPIPYIPVTIDHLPQYSREAIQMVWREACVPLYICDCSICDRANAKASNGKGVAIPTPAQEVQNHQTAPASNPPPKANTGSNKDWPVETQVERLLAEAVSAIPRVAAPPTEAGEEEEDDEDDEEISGSDKDDASSTVPVTDSLASTPPVTAAVPPLMPRKRSSRELDGDEDSAASSGAEAGEVRGGSPPKRARIEAHARIDSQPPISDKIAAKVADIASLAHPRLSKKRSSEELEGDDQENGAQSGAKRCRTISTTADANMAA